MKFKTLTGKLKDIPVHKYLVDWDGKQGSKFSAEALAFFRPYWQYDVVAAELPVAGTKMRYDFVNISRKIIIETDGVAHLTPKSHYHHGSPAKWLAQIKRDEDKNVLAALNGFKMVRIQPDHLPLTKEWLKETYDVIL